MAEPFVGEIKLLGFNFAPVHFAFCAGQELQISQNQTLFSLIQTFYGGNGRTTYQLPNLVSRTPVGYNYGSAPGLSTYDLGRSFGRQSQILSLNELPAHNHTATYTPSGQGSDQASLKASTEDADSDAPTTGAYLANVVRGGGGQDKDEKIYKQPPVSGGYVELGGLNVPSGGGGTVSIGNQGGSQPVVTQSPALAMNFCIALTGIYPSRN